MNDAGGIRNNLAPIAVTMGDPAGIGGEIVTKAWQKLRGSSRPFFVIDDPSRFPSEFVRSIASAAEASRVFGNALPILPVALAAPVIPGQPNGRNAKSVIESIERAVRLAMAGEASAVVTNPISKATLYGAGFAYPGHTEYLAALTNAPFPVMMLLNRELRVVPVTIHVSLRRALDTLTAQAIVDAARVTAEALKRDFGIAAPRLAIAGLNPHAGEGGALGDEEATIIEPAMAQLRAERFDVSGPWPPDTMFTPEARTRYDAAICMYHDQALIPLKTLDMTHGINITLGLPIIRTSPDHGTAFGIAGKGVADPSSIIAALELASALAFHRERAA